MLASARSPGPTAPRAALVEQCQVTPDGEPQVLAPDSLSVLQVYLDAHGLIPGGGGQLLLLGTNNHLFRRLPDGRWQRVGGENLAGAVVDPTDAVSVVPSPLPGRALARPRAVPSGDSGWSVVFLEADLDGLTPNLDNVRAAWFGEIRGGEWTALERLPLPVGRVPVGASPSSLILHSSRLFWAVPVRTDSGQIRVAVFERTEQGQWSVDVVPTVLAVSVDLAMDAEGAPVLAVVHPDRTLRSDGSSLFLWHRRGRQWVQGEKLVPSQREQVWDPVLDIRPPRHMVGWLGRSSRVREVEFRVLLDPLHANRPQPLTVNRSMTMQEPGRPLRLGTSIFFVSEYIAERSGTGLGGLEVRLSQLVADSVELLHAFHPDFVPGLGMAAARVNDSTIVVAGTKGSFFDHPLVATGQADGAVREVHTELFRLVVRCPARTE